MIRAPVLELDSFLRFLSLDIAGVIRDAADSLAVCLSGLPVVFALLLHRVRCIFFPPVFASYELDRKEIKLSRAGIYAASGCGNICHLLKVQLIPVYAPEVVELCSGFSAGKV